MQDADTVQIAIDPAWGIDPAEFARAWNADQDTRAVGAADSHAGRDSGMEAYIDPATATVLVAIGSSVVSSVAAIDNTPAADEAPFWHFM